MEENIQITCGRDFIINVQKALALMPETFKQQIVKSKEDITEQKQRELQVVLDMEGAKTYFKQ